MEIKDENRNEIKDEVYSEISFKEPIPFKEIKDIVQDDDIIKSGWNEGFYSENNSMNGHYSLKVIRKRLETDEEYNKRHENAKVFKEQLRQKRFATYLNLKKEFENEKES